MAAVLPWLRRSDGSLFLLNDSSADHGVDLDRLEALAQRLFGPVEKPEGALFLRDAKLGAFVDPHLGFRLIMDVGSPAPAHQPGHAHAGALGFEIDSGELPLLIDPGSSGYDGDPFRSFFRGTRAHNTIAIDGRDQSEMWGTFRVARRSRVGLDTFEWAGRKLLVRAWCQPYHDRGAFHHRTVAVHNGCVRVEDRVSGARDKRVDLHWHLHPAWSADRRDNTVELKHDGGRRAYIRVHGADEVTLHRGDRDPHLGWFAAGTQGVVPTWTIRASVLQNDERTLFTEIECLR